MAEARPVISTGRSRLAALLRSVLPDRNPPRWLLLGLASLLLAVMWFGRNDYRALTGDDLYLLMISREPGNFANSFWGAFLDVGADKWRPLITPQLALLTRAFDGSYQSWVHLLTVLQWLNVMGATALAWVMSGRRWGVAVVFAIALVTSRFNTYFVWQTLGIMEGFALSAMLVTIACARMAWRTASARWMIAMILAAAAASLCHERYLCLLGFVALVPLLTPVRLNIEARVGWAIAALMVGVTNYFVKVSLLKIDFFAGAAGVDVKPDRTTIQQFMQDGIWSLLGSVRGPAYLTGADGRTLGTLPWLLTAIFTACAVALVVAALVADVRAGLRRLRPWLLGVALLVSLLLVASISIRLEQRWLFAPQVVLLLGLAWAAGRVRRDADPAPAIVRVARRLPASAVLVTALLATAAVDLVYARHVGQIYFMTGQRMTESVLDRVVEQHRLELPSATVFLLSTNGDFRYFYLADGWFFRYYAAPTDPDVRFVADASEIRKAKNLRPIVLVFRVDADQVVEVPVPAAPRPRGPRRSAAPRG